MGIEIKSKNGVVLMSLNIDTLQGADLRGANLQEANLQGADLWGANLRRANLQGADLWGANLRRANLQEADLRGADLEGANLRGANLQEADLRGANLEGADLDFSSGFTFKCTSFDVAVDMRIAHQYIYHFCRMKIKGKEGKLLQNQLMEFANKFHRVEECGKIKKNRIR